MNETEESAMESAARELKDDQIRDRVEASFASMSYLCSVVRKNMWNDRQSLEAVSSGKDLAVRQGRIQGYEFFLTKATGFFISDGSTDDPASLSDIDDLVLSRLLDGFSWLESQVSWTSMGNEFALERARMAHALLDMPKGTTRDIVVEQSKHFAMNQYVGIIRSVREEGRRRAAARAAAAQQPTLFPAPAAVEEQEA